VPGERRFPILVSSGCSGSYFKPRPDEKAHLSREQLPLFAAELGLELPQTDESDDDDDELPAGASTFGSGKPLGRKPLPRNLKRERIEHDLPETEKHCPYCDQDPRRIGEEVSERYE
jgi:hypothetical protein